MQPSHLTFSVSLHADIRQAFYEHHQAITRVMQITLILIPLVGLWVHAMLGVVLGLTVFLLSYYLTPYLWSVTHGE
ncbi:MAG: hypothetical protein KF814_00530 [Nitrospiraceae bacterium]|nr:hypothetical protein [Nitrospiraceae bacterium]